MFNHHQDEDPRPFRHVAKQAIRWTGIVLGLAIVTTVSWNLFAPDLFGMETIRVKQGLGMVVLGSVAACIVRLALHSNSNRATGGGGRNREHGNDGSRGHEDHLAAGRSTS